MKKIIRLTESDLARIVRRVINEQDEFNKDIKPKGIQSIQKLMKKVVHTVKSGDTLGDIALQYGTNVNTLKKLNPQIKDVNKIKVGDKINLPK